MNNNCDYCGSIIYSEIYHKCIKLSEKINEETKVVDYKLITLDELGILAGNNDRKAQDEIVFRYSNQGAIYLSRRYVKPINWGNIIDRAINDQYFMHFLLYFDHDEYYAIFNTLFESVKMTAKTGDSMAQYNLGEMYYQGFGVKKNIQKAIKWIIKSADQNNKYGLINLARFYEDGNGVLLDIDKATKLLEQAAYQNLPNAQYYLGKIYMTRDPRNLELAFKYYEQAANQNHTNAQYWLAIFYKTGKYVSKDNQKAIYWLTLAANQGLNSAKIKLAEMYTQGIYVEQDYQKAFELLNSSIYDDGTNYYYDYIAMSELARMYEYGWGIEKDFSRAIHLHLKSKKLEKIFKIFKINIITFINPINVDCENDNMIDIDQLESKIIYKLQSIMIKLKYEQINIYHIDIENYLQEIENRFTQLIKLRIQLNNSSAMINCLSFKKNTFYNTMIECNIKNLYFNKHDLDDISYLNIGPDNIKLVDDIFENLDKSKFNDMLLDLELALGNKYGEKVDDLINAVPFEDHSHQLNIIKDLEDIKFVQSQIKIISSKLFKYIDAFINDIKSNVHIRNQQFQQEYTYLFGYN
ncbi:putative sel1-like repeat-containing protein [Powai lake megavirus]|uniref:Putative sel1-like repeat-containing protein n=1 Tax=Powai lake megavirus TaxID=1842663 RepID=A0A161HRH7_9VIRU|nr:putative sel1-like repeat-containing protein [Powai lake megavirus]ANB51117.1 putative sel1-like repeat-containing protein [Powai lake megavirus]